MQKKNSTHFLVFFPDLGLVVADEQAQVDEAGLGLAVVGRGSDFRGKRGVDAAGPLNEVEVEAVACRFFQCSERFLENGEPVRRYGAGAGLLRWSW